MKIIKTGKSRHFSWNRFFRDIISDHIFESAATLSYYFLFSVFPLAILINVAISTLNLSQDFALSLSNIIPPQIQTILQSYIGEISSENSTSLFFIGLILTVYSLSKAINTMKRKIRAIFSNPGAGSFLWEWLVSAIFVLLFLGSIYAMLILLVAGNNILNWLFLNIQIFSGIWIFIQKLRYVLVTTFLFFVLFGVYYIFPGVAQKKRDVLLGTIFSLTAWVLASFFFSIYVDRFANYTTLYGSIGTIIMLLSWLFFINLILLLGAHIIANIRHEKEIRRDSDQPMLHRK